LDRFSGGRPILGIQDLTLSLLPENPTAIPEPTTMLLLGSGLIGLVGFRKRFIKK
jgi:hypothetical protein